MFHWHIVDSQSFPLVVPNFQDLAQKGAYSADSVYTPQDVAHIVSYAGAVRSPPSISISSTRRLIFTEPLYSAVLTFLSYVFSQCTVGWNMC
jgi:Glycosyl hydrolase family 20, catalytic domain